MKSKHHTFKAKFKPIAYSDNRTSSETPYDNLLTEAQARKLKRIARRKDVSGAQILREAFEAYARRYG